MAEADQNVDEVIMTMWLMKEARGERVIRRKISFDALLRKARNAL